MQDFNSQPYIDFILSHSKPIEKYSRGKEKNFLCPKCNDGKENNFYFNIENGASHCKKCDSGFSAFEYAKLLGYTSETKTYKSKYLQWDYTDSQGNFLYGKRRFDFNGEKKYIPIIRIDNKEISVTKKDKNYDHYSNIFESIERVIYNYPRVKKSNIIFFVEGEKCAQRLQDVINEASKVKEKSYLKKYASTTVYDSLDVNSKHYINQLSGKIVIIIPDNDKTGFTKAEKIEFALSKYCRVTTITPDKFNLKDKQDVYDYFENKEKTWNSFEEIIKPFLPDMGLNDINRTKDFCNQYGNEIRHSYISGYYVWSGKNWLADDKNVIELIKNYHIKIHDSLMREYKKDTEKNKPLKFLASKMASKQSVKTVYDLSMSDRQITVKESDFDSNNNILNLNNVTYDLINHRTKSHSQDDNLTIISPYNYEPNAKCPQWEKFLKQIFNNDESLIEYIRQSIGYTLTGETRLQCFYFLHGEGSNGKSVFAEMLNRLCNGYATKIKIESLMEKDNNKGGEEASPEIAKLRGKRLVIASEIKITHKLNESLIKDLTGGDSISARNLYKDPFVFTPQGKLWLYGNHKPIIKGTDNGIWRRMKCIPFNVIFSESQKDTMLIDKLSKEISGILNWSLEGLKRLQKNEYKIIEPKAVLDAVKDYRNEMDIIGQFITDNGYTFNQFYKTLSKTFYSDYIEYCKENGHSPYSQRRLSDYLKTNGCETIIGSGNVKSYKGIGKILKNE